MLKLIYPKSSIDVWTKSRSSEILDGNPNVNETLIFDEIKTADYNDNQSISIKKKLKFLKILRKKKYDVCIDLTGKYSTALFALTGGFKYSTGINYNGFGFCYSKYVKIDTQYSKGHLSEKYLNVLKDGLKQEDKLWNKYIKSNSTKSEIFITEKSKTFADEILNKNNHKKIICFQFTAGWKAKEWDRSGYIRLINSINPEVHLIFIGSENDREYNYKILDHTDSDYRNNFFTYPLNIQAELIRRSDLFIGSDSVGLQIAGAVGTPSLAFFGPTNPEFSNPGGEMHYYIYKKLKCSSPEAEQYCTRNAGKTCLTLDCMKEISPEEVLKNINMILDKIPKTKLALVEEN